MFKNGINKVLFHTANRLLVLVVQGYLCLGAWVLNIRYVESEECWDIDLNCISISPRCMNQQHDQITRISANTVINHIIAVFEFQVVETFEVNPVYINTTVPTLEFPELSQ